jgi:hypothetical protein
MLLRWIKSNRNAGYILFPLILLGIFVFQIKGPGTIPEYAFGNTRLIPGLPEYLLSRFPVLKPAVAYLTLFSAGVLIFRINREFIFLNSWSMLPVFIFLFLVLGLPVFGQLHPVWFAVLFFLPAISRLFQVFDVRKPYRNLFESGFLLSMGSLFYFHLLFLLPAFIIGGKMIVRDARWREPFLVFLGAIVPWILTFSVFFMLDLIPDLLQWQKTSILQKNDSILKNLPLLVFISYAALLILSGSITIMRQYSEKKVRFRSFFTFLFFSFISTILSFILIPGCGFEMLVITAVPVSFLLSNYFDSVRITAYKEVVFTLIVLFSLALLFYQMKLWPEF